MKKERLRDARRLALVCAGATVMALNIKSFVRVGGLYPCGFNGLTLLLQAIFSRFLGVELPFTLINLLLNSVPIVISFLFIGKKFTLFSCVTIVLSSVLTDTLPGYPLTNDPLLISVFGGIINAPPAEARILSPSSWPSATTAMCGTSSSPGTWSS